MRSTSRTFILFTALASIVPAPVLAESATHPLPCLWDWLRFAEISDRAGKHPAEQLSWLRSATKPFDPSIGTETVSADALYSSEIKAIAPVAEASWLRSAESDSPIPAAEPEPLSTAPEQSDSRPSEPPPPIRPATLPGGPEPNAAFSIQDVESSGANFGHRIANRYLVVNVILHNPTARKIQLDKSALWFEVDYETLNPPPGRRIQTMEFGRDHNFAQFAEAFPSILGTFDAIAGGREQVLQVLDLGVALLAGLSSGGVLRSTQVKSGIALVTGLILPRVQSIYWNPEVEKRKRTNLISQSAERIIQVPPHAAVQTKVFLPRRGILGLAQTPVRIAKVRQIHIDLETIEEGKP